MPHSAGKHPQAPKFWNANPMRKGRPYQSPTVKGPDVKVVHAESLGNTPHFSDDRKPKRHLCECVMEDGIHSKRLCHGGLGGYSE